MIYRRVMRMPPWAKYAIVAMLLADGLGIYLAHNKINQPVLDGVEEADLVLADPAWDYDEYGLALPRRNTEFALNSEPLARTAQVVPAMLNLRPIDLDSGDDILSATRIEQRAERAAEIPVVRVAAVRQTRRQALLFNKAFARDVAGPTEVGSTLPDVDFAQVRAARVSELQSGAAYGENQAEVPLTSVEAPAQEQRAEPAAALPNNAEAPIAPSEPAPAAPDAGAEGELPPS